jgi:hypothetical protein
MAGDARPKKDRRCGRRDGVPRRERFHVWETFAAAAVRAILRFAAQGDEKVRWALFAGIAMFVFEPARSIRHSDLPYGFWIAESARIFGS